MRAAHTSEPLSPGAVFVLRAKPKMTDSVSQLPGNHCAIPDLLIYQEGHCIPKIIDHFCHLNNPNQTKPNETSKQQKQKQTDGQSWLEYTKLGNPISSSCFRQSYWNLALLH